jgi:hypothetical protein
MLLAGTSTGFFAAIIQQPAASKVPANAAGRKVGKLVKTLSSCSTLPAGVLTKNLLLLLSVGCANMPRREPHCEWEPAVPLSRGLGVQQRVD